MKNFHFPAARGECTYVCTKYEDSKFLIHPPPPFIIMVKLKNSTLSARYSMNLAGYFI